MTEKLQLQTETGPCMLVLPPGELEFRYVRMRGCVKIPMSNGILSGLCVCSWGEAEAEGVTGAETSPPPPPPFLDNRAHESLALATSIIHALPVLRHSGLSLLRGGGSRLRRRVHPTLCGEKVCRAIELSFVPTVLQ